jgi:hypothetical protein
VNLLNWLRCHILNRHDYYYRYREVGGTRTWPDGSISTGPEHIGWICQRCGHYKEGQK